MQTDSSSDNGPDWDIVIIVHPCQHICRRSGGGYARRVSRSAGEEMIEEYRDKLGFNQSVPEQYLSWLKNVLCLDFGNSYYTGRPAMRDLLSAMPVTLLLAGLSCVLIIAAAVPLGILAALREGTWADRLIMGLSFFSVSVPGYFSAYCVC